jgi:transcription antitermination factor NusG
VTVETTISSEVLWFVAHARPRCEKKIVSHCERLNISTTLPLYRSVRKYRGKTVVFEKPLFPGYVFLQAVPQQKQSIFQSDYVANLLDVPDQTEFQHQLADILQALDTGLEIQLAPEIGKGTRVKVKYGPLQGVEGWVEERYGFDTVLLRLDFIGQAAAVKLTADNLERV